jgi:hypothetical protein
MKKLIATILTVALIVSAFSFPAFASSNTQTSDITIAPYEEIISQYVDLQEFCDYIIPQLQNCSESVDVSEFNFPVSDKVIDALIMLITENIPVLFHVENGLGYSYYGQTISSLKFSYDCSASEYKQQLALCESVADKLLSGIKDNASLTNVEKALLIHDRLAVWCEYDNTRSSESHCMRRALLDRIAVCDGYAAAYSYLLDKVGIQSDICVSKSLEHAWNIVYLDDKAYHVDVTWDDKSQDVTGKVDHENFLRSTNGIIETGHIEDGVVDYNTIPSDTTYDNYYWQNSNAEMQLIGNDIYYIDNQNKQIKIVGTDNPVVSINSTWHATANSYWTGNFSRLSSDGRYLFYSTADKIYEYDTVTKTTKTIVSVTPSQNNYFSIYGMTYEDGYLIYNTFNSPNYMENTKEQYTVKKLYPEMCNHNFQNGVCQNCDAVMSVSSSILTSFNSSLVGEVTVPLKLNDVYVTTIGENAFKNATRLTSVTIPDSVTEISENAFENCTSLKQIIVHDSVKTISNTAFKNVSNDFKIICYKGSTIGNWAEQNCISVEYTEIHYGDVDSNSTIDIFDLISLAKHVVSTNYVIDLRAANVKTPSETDRNVDIMDLIALAKYICNGDTTLGPNA